MKTSASILLVDDQPDLLDNLSLTLGMAGYQTVTASDGFEALAVLQRQPVDLILSDITMPRLDGYQLYHRVRQNPEWAKIPFLFLTGCGFLSDGEIRYGKALGIDEYLSKPIRSKELLAAVQRVLRRTQ
jgi:CheY-like chemotaxis protein